MSKPWLQSYPEGVPAEISIDEYASVADIFDQSVCKYEELPAYSNFGKTINYREVKEFTSQTRRVSETTSWALRKAQKLQ